MKIALLGPISTAGISQFLHESPPPGFPVGYGGAPFMNTLIAELLAKGHEVCAITAGGYPATRSSEPLHLTGPRFSFYCCPSRKHSIRPTAGRVGRILDFFAYERRNMEAVLSEVRPNFIHAHWTYEFAMAAMASGIPYLVSAHDDPAEVLKLSKDIYRLGRYAMARHVFRHAKALTAVSDDLKRRITPFARTDISVVANPLSYQFIDAGAAPKSRSASHRKLIISVINGWGHLKNTSNAMIAFSHIRGQFPDATYHLYGSDYQPGGAAEQWAQSQGLAEGLVFHGPVSHDELVTALEDATLMLHPSRSESCPMGIAEALALGLPVVGGNKSGGVPWMIGDAGLLADINNPLGIADAVLQLLTDDVLYAKCATAALQRVKAFKPELIADQYEEMYRRILKQASLCI